MLTGAVRNLFGRFGHQPLSETVAALVHARVEPEIAEIVVEPHLQTAWPPARLAMAHLLWGEGYICPGGEIETLQLARPLGVSAATSLMVIGSGSGGPAAAVTQSLGTWVTGLEADPDLLAVSVKFIKKAQLDKKVTIKGWDPKNPDFVARSHHHCLALEPRLGAHPEPILDGLARALRPGGQLVLTMLATASALNLADQGVKRWAKLERWNATEIPSAVAVTRMLGRVGLDVRVTEDISTRHMDNAMLGWRVLLRDLEAHKPSRSQAVQLVAEAELWLLRRRLIRSGGLRMMRWHAISRAPVI